MTSPDLYTSNTKISQQFHVQILVITSPDDNESLINPFVVIC